MLVVLLSFSKAMSNSSDCASLALSNFEPHIPAAPSITIEKRVPSKDVRQFDGSVSIVWYAYNCLDEDIEEALPLKKEKGLKSNEKDETRRDAEFIDNSQKPQSSSALSPLSIIYYFVRSAAPLTS
uniref:Uncharacterized protein n=1 Tax=Pseudo-nitzschia australis TaxID=44445 RepID=A0A7S4AHM5_9STRA